VIPELAQVRNHPPHLELLARGRLPGRFTHFLVQSGYPSRAASIRTAWRPATYSRETARVLVQIPAGILPERWHRFASALCRPSDGQRGFFRPLISVKEAICAKERACVEKRGPRGPLLPDFQIARAYTLQPRPTAASAAHHIRCCDDEPATPRRRAPARHQRTGSMLRYPRRAGSGVACERRAPVPLDGACAAVAAC
jgi:hypothetical protein